MLLDDNAEVIDIFDEKEISEILPSLKGKDIIEIGAGIGRLTKYLAPQCKFLVAIDFMESFIQKNQNDNGHYGNISCQCADATQFKAPSFSSDFVFTNWLLMYLNDKECEIFAKNTLNWLRVGGFIFIRESCLFQSGSKQRSFNPTFYRNEEYYFNLFNTIKIKNILLN